MAGRVRVLFVDDDELVLNALRRTFSREPYDCFFASDARLGLRMVAQHGIDVVVSDYLMPGMNGVEFFEQLFTKHRNVMRVMITGVGAPPAAQLPAGSELVKQPAPMDIVAKTKLKAARAAVRNIAFNDGQAHRFVEKPWNDEELKSVVADMAAIALSTRKR